MHGSKFCAHLIRCSLVKNRISNSSLINDTDIFISVFEFTIEIRRIAHTLINSPLKRFQLQFCLLTLARNTAVSIGPSSDVYIKLTSTTHLLTTIQLDYGLRCVCSICRVSTDKKEWSTCWGPADMDQKFHNCSGDHIAAYHQKGKTFFVYLFNFSRQEVLRGCMCLRGRPTLSAVGHFRG